MKKIILYFILSTLPFSIFAQSERKVFKIGIFAPLYLDSVFNGTLYKFGKKFPRFAVQGMSFVQGIQIAIDSFPIDGANIETFIFDSQSDSLSIKNIINSHRIDNFNLVIGAVKDNEFAELASFANRKKIPFISATYPNDGGVTSNPYLIMLNPTLKSHCQTIFGYLLQHQDSAKIIHVRQTGSQEDRVAEYINNINKPDDKVLLNIKTIILDSNFASIKNSLDSNKKNIIIGGSLDEDFANPLLSTIKNIDKKYKVTIFGMPNWEGFSSLETKLKDLPKNITYLYTSPYFNEKSDSTSKKIQDIYLKKFKGRPSEYLYKGFEIMYVFSRILNNYPDDFLNHINDAQFQMFTSYKIIPVKVNKNSKSTDYLENKHLYFLKKTNSIISQAQ